MEVAAAFPHRSEVSQILLTSDSDVASVALRESLFVATMRSCGLGITVAIWGVYRGLRALIAPVNVQCAFKIDRRALDRASPHATCSRRQTILLVLSVLSSEGVFTGVLGCLAPCHVRCRRCWRWVLSAILWTFHHRTTH